VSCFLQGKLGRVSSPLALLSKKIMNDLFRRDHGIGYCCDFRKNYASYGVDLAGINFIV
jgi:hypothetical protein